MPSLTYEYGNSEQFRYESYRPEYSGPCIGLVERTTITEDAYYRALDDINYSLQVRIDKPTGQKFEIAVVNRFATDDTVDLELSTFTSSITNNIGNAIEFAEHAALYPNRRRVYVASFGNGGTSYWSPKEQDYIKTTGRFVDPEGKPLPTVAALQRVLYMADLAVSRLSANSAGGAHSTALMAALPEGQVTHAYLKSRPNISSHPFGLGWGLSLMAHERADERRYKRHSQDRWRMTDDIMVQARKHLEFVYGELSGKWSAKQAATASGRGKLWTDMQAFSKGGARNGYPAVHDTAAALRQQPDAKLTYHFPAEDRLYRHLRTDLTDFMGKLATRLPLHEGQIEAMIVPGTHHDHSQYPSLRWSMEKYAFSK